MPYYPAVGRDLPVMSVVVASSRRNWIIQMMLGPIPKAFPWRDSIEDASRLQKFDVDLRRLEANTTARTKKGRPNLGGLGSVISIGWETSDFGDGSREDREVQIQSL